MASHEITALLGGWPGFELVNVQREDATPARSMARIVLTLQALAGHPKTCSRCGRVVSAVHDISPREVRDLPILDAETWLVVPRARVRCPDCGPTVETVAWLDRYQRMTTRLVEAIVWLCQVATLTHVAQWYGVGWDTVKQIDHRALARRLGPVDLRGLRIIAIDEFAVHRGHRYATIVADPITKRVLWVGRGRAREDLRVFVERLGPAGCAQLEAVVADRSPAITTEVHASCPAAVLVYDRYHVEAKYAQEVVDRVRIAETNRLGRAIPRGAVGGMERTRSRAV